MYRKKHRRGRRLVSMILSGAMLVSVIPIQAAEFTDAWSTESLFSSGESDSYAGFSADVADDTPTEAAEPDSSQTSDISPSPSVTPSVSPEPSVTPSPEVSPVPSVIPEPTETPVPTETPTPTPTINPEKEVMLRFVDGEGNECEQLRTVLEWNESLLLPHVPDSEAPDMWKLEKDEKLGDAITLKGGSLLTLKKGESWSMFIQNGVLNFYMPKKCTVSLCNNSGTAVFANGTLKIYETKKVILPDITSSTYINYGWTDIKAGADVKYELNSEYTVTDDINFYMVRRAACQVTFLSSTGGTNSTFAKLNQRIGKGLTISLPQVPAKTGYQALGWSKSKNASKASYSVGKSVKISAATNFYAVYKKLPYVVKFNNNAGTSSSKVYTSLSVYVAKNQTITLPEVPRVKGYVNLGWTTQKGKTTPVYKAGSKVKISNSTTYYAVRRKSKYYTITYYLGNGSTSTAYKKLTQTVEEDTTVDLAKVPARTGYINLGWSTSKNATTATVTTPYTVSKNIKLYAVQKKAVTITLHQFSGALYQKTTLAVGSSFELPGVRDADGYTFMGWSTKAQQTVNPQYEAEDKITVNSNMDLYAVVFKKSAEKDLTEDELPQINPYRYKQIIFVGDSRTEYMKNVLNGMGQTAIQNIKFVCAEGQGLSWFQTTGYSQICSLIKNSTNSIYSPKTAVIFNFGVNDLGNYEKYVEFYNSIEPVLTNKGCKLYFMSVNPVNRKMLASAGRGDRSEAKLRAFNTYMKAHLAPEYTYIDMYSYLKSTGYGYCSNKYTSSGSDDSQYIDDGLHYTSKTYKHIYARCMNLLN